MKYLKTFEENFLTKIWNKINKVPEDREINAIWDIIEIEELENLGFEKVKWSEYEYEFKSLSKDLIIKVFKFFDEVAPGCATVRYNAYVNDRNKEFGDFKLLINFFKREIPEDEIIAKKYNL